MACTPLQPLPACTSEVSGCAALHAQVLAQNGGTGWDLLTKLAALHCHPDFQLELHCWGLHPAVHGIGLTFAAELLGVAHSLDAVCRWSIQAPACTTAEVDTWGWEPNHRCARRQSPACMSLQPS